MKTRILPVLSVLFAVVLVSRSIALSSEVSTAKKVAVAETAKINAAQTSQREDTQQCLTGDVLLSVNKKMEVLKQREAEMAEQESAFSAIKTRLQKELAVVEAAKNELAKQTHTRSEIAQGDIVHLTTMYATMKPKQAAQIFNRMDPKFAAGFIREMKGGQAGLILAAMDTKKAYEISLVIASRYAQYRPRADANLP